jgi:hypothetical protein
MPKRPTRKTAATPAPRGDEAAAMVAADDVAGLAEQVEAVIDEMAATAEQEQKARKAARPRPAKEAQAKEATDDWFVSLGATEEKLNVLWYGREGTGKTTNAASLANLGRTLLVNAEAGLHKGPLAKRGINTDNLMLYPKPGQPLTFEGLEELHYRLANDLADDPNSWAGCGFDSLTEIHKALLEGITKTAREKAARKGQERDRWFVDRADWGVMSEQMRVLLRRFRDLPCHFAATALERRDVDETTGKVQYGPALTPALQTDVLGYVTLVLYVKSEELGGDEDGETEFRALTKASGRYRAKDRLDILPRVLVNPRFDKIVQYANGSMDESDDPDQIRRAERLAQEAAAALEAATQKEIAAAGTTSASN